MKKKHIKKKQKCLDFLKVYDFYRRSDKSEVEFAVGLRVFV